MSEDPPFALCLTHDVDRPYKRLHQSLYYALTRRSLGQLRSLARPGNPYWQFEDILDLESALGVRSAFYFLDEPHLRAAQSPRAWLRPDNWVQHLGRYDPSEPPFAALIRTLDDGGWEVGLHGSYHSADNPDRLRAEKARLESLVGHPVAGVRQHYLRLSVPGTWQAQAEMGFRYDTSLGSSESYGFAGEYRLKRPLDDSFVVFPLTLMESTLPDPGADPEAAWAVCRDLLEEAAEHNAVMTALWHPRYFSEAEFPGYRGLYRRLVEAALDAGAWVGPPADFLDTFDVEDWAEAADYSETAIE